MPLSLIDILNYDNKNTEISARIDDRQATSLEDVLLVIDQVTDITSDKDDPLTPKYVADLCGIILQKLQEKLRNGKENWHKDHSPELFTIAKQLEAIAYLTGDKENIEKILDEFPLLKTINCNFNAYQTKSFLWDGDETFKFENFDRSQLTLQLMLRVLDPRYIQQRDEQVCGVTSFVQNLALVNPLLYVQMVDQLASEGEFDFTKLHQKHGDFRIKITEEAVLKKEKSDGVHIHDADHIILNGIRSAENTLSLYSPEGAELFKKMFGVSTAKELARWLQQSGYSNVGTLSITDREEITQLQLLIDDGYTVEFLGTSTLANVILNPEDGIPEKQGKIAELMDGHFFLIKKINYDRDTDSVTLRIITWGEEKSLTIPYEAWKNHQGYGQAIIGQNPYMASNFRTKVREIVSPLYCSPEAYCLMVRNVIGNDPKYEEIMSFLQKAYRHEKGKTWMESAKQIQDFIEALPAEERPDIPREISIIPTVTEEKINQFNAIYQNPKIADKISSLEKMRAEEDNI